MSIIIGIDHGYYAIKTAHCSFPAGLTSYGEHEPYTRQGLLEFGGCFFVCGSGRQPIQRDKTVNDNYYLLTLAAIAKEIHQRGLPPECSVRIAAGLPLTSFGRDKPKFKDYLLRSNQPVNYNPKCGGAAALRHCPPDAGQLGIPGAAQPERHRPGGTGQAAEHLGHAAGVHHQRARRLRPHPLRRQHCAVYQQFPQEHPALPAYDHQAGRSAAVKRQNKSRGPPGPLPITYSDCAFAARFGWVSV